MQQLRKWKWILTAGLCFLLLYLLPSSFIEEHYSRGFFLWIRKLLDNTFGKMPFPSYYLFLLVLFLIVLKWFLHFFKEKPQPVVQRLIKIASFAGIMITLFFIMWGFNYGRIPLENQIQLTVKPLTNEQLLAETQTTILILNKIRTSIKKDTNPIPEIVFINNIEQNSRDALDSTLHMFKYPFSTKIRGRFLLEDMFLFVGIGGQYLPYTGEGNVDDAVYYSKKPFYLIHEMAHGNGFTNEAECNFLAYVSCVESGNLSLEYSGELNYLLYLIEALKIKAPDQWEQLKQQMPAALQNDLEAIRKYYLEHTFKSAYFGDKINNYYLKTMGIKEGVKNYDKMIDLVFAWKQK